MLAAILCEEKIPHPRFGNPYEFFKGAKRPLGRNESSRMRS
jgi:hypothetical protein